MILPLSQNIRHYLFCQDKSFNKQLPYYYIISLYKLLIISTFNMNLVIPNYQVCITTLYTRACPNKTNMPHIILRQREYKIQSIPPSVLNRTFSSLMDIKVQLHQIEIFKINIMYKINIYYVHAEREIYHNRVDSSRKTIFSYINKSQCLLQI